ncbi:hypothetical protein EON79_11625 [bacterium]|nr:MAG: hypothetical protein EON79_11625 [bacterium]
MIPIPAESTRIVSTTWLTGPKVVQYARAELRADVTGPVRDAFDSDDVRLDARIVTPSGKRLSVPGFLYQPFTRKVGVLTRPIAILSTQALADGKASPTETTGDGEILSAAGSKEWRVRFAPMEKGTYKVALFWKTKGGQASAPAKSLTVSAAKGGFVGVSRRDPRYFALTDGTPYWPIGTNLGWSGARGLRDFENWIPAFAGAGANWGRLWLAPHWTTFALERPGQGPIDLGNAWRLDRVLGLAERSGMRLALCIESYNVLRDKINWPEWERSPLNRSNGGPLARPADFWTDPEAARRFRSKLRYLVARYGASSAVMSWEFWNEVDGITDYDAAKVRAWHERMANHLKAVDPYRHLVTTSFGGYGAAAGDAETFKMPGLDYAQTHSYEAPDLAVAVDEANRRLGGLGKPHFVGEVGADTSGPREKEDLEGMQIHDPLWASLAVGDGGAAMPWWWDSYVFPQKHYRLFRPIADFIRGVAFDREGFQRATPRIEFAQPPAVPERKDVTFTSGFPGWKPSVENSPRTIRITRQGADDLRPLSSFQQGTGNHADLHNPITFEIDLPWPTRVVAEVTDVSGYGGAKFLATLDGQKAIERDFPDPDGDRVTDTLKQFAGDYAVEVPAGRHTVRIENPGQDWFQVSFRIVNAAERTGPPLRAWAVAGKSTVIAWVRQEDRTWRAVAVQKKPFPPVPPSVLVFPGLKGSWSAEVWDTRTGKILARPPVKDGRVPLPKVETDVAVKLKRSAGVSPANRKLLPGIPQG